MTAAPGLFFRGAEASPGDATEESGHRAAKPGSAERQEEGLGPGEVPRAATGCCPAGARDRPSSSPWDRERAKRAWQATRGGTRRGTSYPTELASDCAPPIRSSAGPLPPSTAHFNPRSDAPSPWLPRAESPQAGDHRGRSLQHFRRLWLLKELTARARPRSLANSSQYSGARSPGLPVDCRSLTAAVSPSQARLTTGEPAGIFARQETYTQGSSRRLGRPRADMRLAH